MYPFWIFIVLYLAWFSDSPGRSRLVTHSLPSPSDILCARSCSWRQGAIINVHQSERMFHIPRSVECMECKSNSTWVRSEVSLLRRLWLPLSVHIWSHPPTQPMHEMYNETMTLQIDHNTVNYVPYSFRQVCGFFNIPCWPCNTEDAGDGAYGL